MVEIYKNLYQFTQDLSFMNFTIHQYLFLGEEPILIYTGTYDQAKAILPKVKELLKGRKLKYILVPHMESDECGGLEIFYEEYKDVTTICSQLCSRELPGFGYKGKIQGKKQGDIIEGKDFAIRCIDYPSEVHLQNGLLFYDEKNKIFFSSDLMMTFGPAAGKTRDSSWNKEVDDINLKSVPNEEKLNELKKSLHEINPRFVAVMHGYTIKL